MYNFTMSSISFTEWLNAEVERRGWSFGELGRRADLSSGMISKVMTEQVLPSWNFCFKVSQALQMPAEDVFRRAGLLPSLPKAIEEEQEAIAILRGLSDSTRRAAMQMLRGLGRSEDLPTASSESPAAQLLPPGIPADHPYDAEMITIMKEIVEGLEKISPQKREELTAKYLMLLEVEELLDHKFDEVANE